MRCGLILFSAFTILGCAPELEEVPKLIPLEYQGRWSINPESCDRSTLQTGDWFYVVESGVGSFEHGYEVESLEAKGEWLRFTTAQGGPAGELQLIDESNMRVRFASGPVEILTLCSKDIDG